MIIYLINNHTLKVDDFYFHCVIGKNGTSNKKIEGDKKTPIGTYKLGDLYYRKDRSVKPETKLKCIEIKKNMGWCDDVNSKHYNTLIKFPFKFSAEKLYLKKKIYDIILVLNFNLRPVIRNKGSAIFLHISKKKIQSH
mgnify:CR=1 FL=1